MKLDRINKIAKSAIAACGLLVLATATGCGFQTNIAGQTLPSAYYLSDDINFNPAGPENKLQNTINAHAQYRADQLGVREGFNEEAP